MLFTRWKPLDGSNSDDYDYVNLESKAKFDEENEEVKRTLPQDMKKAFDVLVRQSESLPVLPVKDKVRKFSRISIYCTPFCRSRKIKIPVFFLFLCERYLTCVNVCQSSLERGNFCPGSARLSLKRHCPFRVLLVMVLT